MVKRKLFKFSLPAILLAALVSGIVWFAPVLINKDTRDMTVLVTATPRSIFIGDIFTLTVDVIYPKDRVTVKFEEIQIAVEPFELLDKSKISEQPGEIIVGYKLRCLENVACAANKTYVLPPIVVYYVDKFTNKVEQYIVMAEPIFISAQIDLAAENLYIRYPQEPFVKNNIGLFSGIILSGIFLMIFGLLGLYTILFGSKKTERLSLKDAGEHSNNFFLKRLEGLNSLLVRNGNPRLVFAQIAGIIEDYLGDHDNKDVAIDLHNKLVVLKKDSEDRAYQENSQNEPTMEEAAGRIREVSLILSKTESGQS